MEPDNLSFSDFNDICRTCLTKGDLKFIYENCTSNSDCLVEMLMTCTLVQFSEKELLPRKICSNCLQDIENAYNFAKKCEKSDNLLRKTLEESRKNIKTEKSTITVKQEENKEKIYEDEKFYEIISEEVIIETQNSVEYEINTNKQVENESEKLEIKEKSKRRKKYECRKCCKLFPTYHDLKLHHLNFIHPSSMICEICSKVIIRKNFRLHMKTQHLNEKNQFKCEVCNKSFNYKQNMLRHIKSNHQNRKPFVCETCGNAYTRLYTLQIHINKVHLFKDDDGSKSGLAPKKSNSKKLNPNRKCPPKSFVYAFPNFRCDSCRRIFDSEDQLIAHSKTHTKQKQFLCNICGKTTTSKGNLLTHMRTHSNLKREKNYPCTICNKSFTLLSSLNNHMYQHKENDQRPYSCTVCNKSFIQQHHWQYHMRRHENITPFECEFCPKKFVSKDILKVHKRIHTGETPYWCKVCERGFYDTSRLKRHKCSGAKNEEDGNVFPV